MSDDDIGTAVGLVKPLWPRLAASRAWCDGYIHPDLSTVSLEHALHALSDPVRLDIVRQLDREVEASCAALDGGCPKSSMSHHFRVLRAAGLVHTRIAGVQHMNTLRREEVDKRFPGLLDAVLGVKG